MTKTQAGRSVAPGLLAALALSAWLPATAAKASEVTKKEAKPHQVLFAPAGYEKVVILAGGGKDYKYYLFTTAKPLKLEIAGPTKLEIMVRLLYDMTMKGTQDFSVKIEEEGLLGAATEVGSYSLKAVKSGTSRVKGEAVMVPSKAHTFDLTVPEGKHVYLIGLKTPAAKSALIRVLMPRKDLKVTRKRSNK